MNMIVDVLIYAAMAAILIPFCSYIAFLVWAIVTGKGGASMPQWSGRR